MSELKKLTDRLAGCKNFHVSPGPDWNSVAVEDRAKAINDALDAIERGDAEEVIFDDGVGLPEEKT